MLASRPDIIIAVQDNAEPAVEMMPLLPTNSASESKMVLHEEKKPQGERQAYLRDLRDMIALLKLGIRKRQRPFQGLMLLTMAGTAVYLIYDYVGKVAFDEQLNSNWLQRDFLVNQTETVKQEWHQLEANSRSINEAIHSLKLQLAALKEVFDTKLQITCTHPFKFYVGTCEALLHDTCNIIIQNGCYIFDRAAESKCNYVANIRCDLNTDLNGQNILRYKNELKLQATQHLLDSLYEKLANLSLDDDYYDWISNVVVFYLVTLGLGEVTPFAVMVAMMLTNILSCIPSTNTCLDLGQVEKDEVVDIATRRGIPHNNLVSYPKLLQQGQAAIDKSQWRAKARHAFFDGARNETSAISVLTRGDGAHRMQPKIAIDLILSFVDENQSSMKPK